MTNSHNLVNKSIHILSKQLCFSNSANLKIFLGPIQFSIWLPTCLPGPCTTGIFPSEWKKGNIVPICKKGHKQTLKNYRPATLLPICGKILERLIFNEMFNFFY